MDTLKWIRMGKLFIYLFLILIVAPLYLYLTLPVLSPWFQGLPTEILFISIIITLLEVKVVKGQKSLVFGIALLTAVISFLYLVVMNIASMELGPCCL